MMFAKLRRYVKRIEEVHLPDKWVGLFLFSASILLRSWWLDARDLSIDEPFSVYQRLFN
jgi:hypothetical protein